MSFDRKRIGELELVTLAGRFDTESAQRVERKFDELTSGGNKSNTVVDMAGVDYVSSSMIRVLLKSLKRHRAVKGDLQLAALQPNIMKVIKIAGMDALFTIYETRDEALASFTK